MKLVSCDDDTNRRNDRNKRADCQGQYEGAGGNCRLVSEIGTVHATYPVGDRSSYTEIEYPKISKRRPNKREDTVIYNPDYF